MVVNRPVVVLSVSIFIASQSHSASSTRFIEGDCAVALIRFAIGLGLIKFAIMPLKCVSGFETMSTCSEFYTFLHLPF